ncbi:ATP-binding protein [Streptomyces marincola]|uniref:ATP-binding protein n=1 Tax=Streptomyces marincola TaxID=2878388 RepID=UPI0021005CE2|nr:ATP-binding protein [Streptomyces marincola]
MPRLRHAVGDFLREHAPLSAERRDAALLILSELLTNAVRHAGPLTPRIAVEAGLDGARLRLSVEDGHPYRPRALDPHPEAQDIGGRGLLLVQVLAAEAGGDCGVDPTASGGKIIWATLPYDRA